MYKKGDMTEFENYRPVTSLPAAAKLLEKVACEQTSKYMSPPCQFYNTGYMIALLRN